MWVTLSPMGSVIGGASGRRRCCRFRIRIPAETADTKYGNPLGPDNDRTASLVTCALAVESNRDGLGIPEVYCNQMVK